MVGHLEETLIMTRNERQLILKDLCARFPYGVICKLSAKDTDVSITEKLEIGGLEHFISGAMDVKPYLRPMSSMTEDEVNQYYKIRTGEDRNKPLGELDAELFDFYHKNHIDYRGLIPMGLALEAPEGMYKTKIQ